MCYNESSDAPKGLRDGKQTHSKKGSGGMLHRALLHTTHDPGRLPLRVRRYSLSREKQATK